MTALRRQWAADLTHLWFERLSPIDWFRQDDDIDAMVERKFAQALCYMATQPDMGFVSDPDMALAAILLFDQVPRNIHRNTAKAFAFDGKALRLARIALTRGFDTHLPRERRQFMAMPLMHSETRADQAASLAYFGAHLADNLPFARSHHAMIARFGRFPHRNAVLGRKSTAAERDAIAAGFSW